MQDAIRDLISSDEDFEKIWQMWQTIFPKWPIGRKRMEKLLHQLRAEVWGRGLGVNSFSGFDSQLTIDTKPEKSNFPIASPVFYANA